MRIYVAKQVFINMGYFNRAHKLNDVNPTQGGDIYTHLLPQVIFYPG